jgi:ribonucleotide reductase alpha subunit
MTISKLTSVALAATHTVEDRVEHLGIQVHTKDPAYISDFSRTLLGEYYIRAGETISQALARPAVAFCFGDYELAQRIYDYAYSGWFMYASPVLSNASAGEWIIDPEKDGANYWYKHQFISYEKSQGLPISCFAMEALDSLDGQRALMDEMANMSTAGGGTGVHNSIRATSSKAPGPIPYMKVLDSIIGYYRQGKTRKGALAYYMDSDHPDVQEHVRFRVPGGDAKRRSDNRQQFHSAVNITDEFIVAILDDTDYELVCPHSGKVYETVNARTLWEDMVETRALTGEPYLLKIDLANRKLPESQRALGLEIKGSNLCVAPETLVLTDVGYEQIVKLWGRQVRVWNGYEFSTVTVLKTGTDQELLKVTTDSGHAVDCTPYHKFYTLEDGELVERRAADLTPGDAVYVVENLEKVPVKIKSVEWTGRISDTYCFTEPLRHMGVFNGILAGNCSEITLPTNHDRSFVCCLSSLNLERYDEWKDTNIVQDLVRFLDNVVEHFIRNAPAALSKAVYSAERERALGMGYLGWHSLLQKRGIPFEGGGFGSSVQLTHEIFGLIQARAEESSRQLAKERGEALDMVGTGLRNSRLTSAPPTANSADLANSSPGIEPWYRNVFIKDTRAGAFLIKNPYLQAILQDLGLDTEATWMDINDHDGSVQHMVELTDHQKLVFKTAMEMDQHWIIELAEQRGPYVDQAQSLNVFFPAGSDRAYVMSVHMKFLLSPNVLTMYYFRTEKRKGVDKVKDIERKALVDWNPAEGEEHVCVSCQG